VIDGVYILDNYRRVSPLPDISAVDFARLGIRQVT
jgi:hypothetical protein